MSYLLIAGSLAAAGLVIWISARFFKHPFSPFSVFYGVWFIAFALLNLHWIEYIPIRRSIWMLIAISLLSFGLGWIVPYLSWNPREFESPEMVKQQVSADRLRIVIFLCFALGVLWAITFLLMIRSTIGLATFIEAPAEIRTSMAENADMQEPLIAFDWLNVANVPLCCFYLFVLKGPRRIIIWPILFFSLAALFLMQDRTHFFYAASWAVFVLLHSMRVTLKRVATVAALGIALLLAQFMVVAIWLGKVAENSSDLLQAANVQDTMTFVLPPYMYITESFASLQVYIDSQLPSTHGLMTFYPTLRLLRAVDPTLRTPSSVVTEFVQVPFDSNTFTWLQQFYDDFGTAGVVIGPWFIGVLTSFVYFRMLRTRSFYSTLVNGLFSYCAALSVFANHFTQGPAWYFLVVSFAIAVWVKAPIAKLRLVEG
jgi:oligosaccharide repeat unit polymerase